MADTWYYQYMDPETVYQLEKRDRLFSELEEDLMKKDSRTFYQTMYLYGRLLTESVDDILNEEVLDIEFMDNGIPIVTNSEGEEEFDDYSSISSYHTSENEPISSEDEYDYIDEDLDHDYWSDY